MKIASYACAALLICSLSSCSLIGSLLRIPASLLQSVGRTVGVGGLTDEAPSPITPENKPLGSPDAEQLPAPSQNDEQPAVTGE